MLLRRAFFNLLGLDPSDPVKLHPGKKITFLTFIIRAEIILPQQLFSPLDQQSNGLMPSLFVRNAPCDEISKKPFSNFFSNCA